MESSSQPQLPPNTMGLSTQPRSPPNTTESSTQAQLLPNTVEPPTQPRLPLNTVGSSRQPRSPSNTVESSALPQLPPNTPGPSTQPQSTPITSGDRSTRYATSSCFWFPQSPVRFTYHPHNDTMSLLMSCSMDAATTDSFTIVHEMLAVGERRARAEPMNFSLTTNPRSHRAAHSQS
jgi:hypothetical protein